MSVRPQLHYCFAYPRLESTFQTLYTNTLVWIIFPLVFFSQNASFIIHTIDLQLLTSHYGPLYLYVYTATSGTAKQILNKKGNKNEVL